MMRSLRNLFRRRTLLELKADKLTALLRAHPTARTHDMRRTTWGHNMTATGTGSYAVWTVPRVQVGDHILTEGEEFVVFECRPCGDPPDMAFIKFWKLCDISEDWRHLDAQIR